MTKNTSNHPSFAQDACAKLFPAEAHVQNPSAFKGRSILVDVGSTAFDQIVAGDLTVSETWINEIDDQAFATIQELLDDMGPVIVDCKMPQQKHPFASETGGNDTLLAGGHDITAVDMKGVDIESGGDVWFSDGSALKDDPFESMPDVAVDVAEPAAKQAHKSSADRSPFDVWI